MPINAIKPPLSLVGQLLTFSDLDYWVEDDGYGDPWLGAPYRWTVTIDLYGPQLHGNHRTREPMVYTAQDVKVGDWVAEISTGRSVKIINIDVGLTNGSSIVCDVEDVDRFNIYSDMTQSGVAMPYGDVLIFSVGLDGLPIFGPISFYNQYVSSNTGFVGDVLSNFRYRNSLRDVFRIHQPGHTFEDGDTVYIDGGAYSKGLATTSSAAKILGTVSSVGTPGQDYFAIKPFAPITTKISPPLPGAPGDLIYLDTVNPGKLTASKPQNFANAVYIKIDDTTGMAIDRGLTEPVNNYSASAPPTTTDDSSAGYQVGSTWVDTVAKKNYVCVDDVTGSAQWVNTSLDGRGTARFVFPSLSLTWVVEHEKNSRYFTYNIYDDTNNPVLPNDIEVIDDNAFAVHFTAAMAGFIVVSFV